MLSIFSVQRREIKLLTTTQTHLIALVILLPVKVPNEGVQSAVGGRRDGGMEEEYLSAHL